MRGEERREREGEASEGRAGGAKHARYFVWAPSPGCLLREVTWRRREWGSNILLETCRLWTCGATRRGEGVGAGGRRQGRRGERAEEVMKREVLKR